MAMNKESNPFTLSENIKTMKHSKSMKNNLNKKFNPEFIRNKNEITENNNKNKRLFIARKLEPKDIVLNNFCRKGIKEIFNNEKLYFSDKYCNNTIKIGNGNKNLILSNPKINIEKKKFVKKKTMNLSSLRTLSKVKTLWRDSQRNKLDDSNINNLSILSRYDYRKLTMNHSSLIKRPSISFKDKENISDIELKIYFQNIKNKINEKNKSRNDKNFLYIINNNRNTSGNKSIANEIKNRLFLQEKILNEFKTYNMNNINIIKKLKKFSKKNKDNLLINQINNFGEKKYNNNNSIKKQNTENHLKMIEWLSSLRQYNNLQKNISLNKKYGQMYTGSNSTNNIKKEQILENYINKLHYSFGNNCTLYSDIDSPLNPICSLIKPENLKKKEISKISYHNEKNKNKKNYLPIIVGKSLIDYEIELTKELEGKKKVFFQRNYPEDDIKPLTFANSVNIVKTKINKAITNTLYLHNNK